MTLRSQSDSPRLRIAMALMEQEIGFNVIGKYDLTPRPDETVFDAMTRQGIARSPEQAAMMAGKEIPPPRGGTWNGLAAWVESYLKEEAGMPGVLRGTR